MKKCLTLLLAAGLVFSAASSASAIDFNQLKNLDSETTQKYIPYTELFPDATENTDLSDEITETFSLFFRKFDYKISDVSISAENNSATVSVKLTTISSQTLARDFKTGH